MSQEFLQDNYFDPTRLLFVKALTEYSELKSVYPKREIATSVYRLYRANMNLASRNMHLPIRMIEKYGVTDIEKILEENVKEFIKKQKNNSITMDQDNIYLDIDDYSSKTNQLTKQVVTMLAKKYYKITINEIENIDIVKTLDDTNIEEFGQCALKNRAMEDFQYCPLCEETNVKKLYVARILRKDHITDESMLTDKNNTLLLCREEWLDFVNGKFYIEENGRIINNGSQLVVNGMRISRRILTKERIFYINEAKKYKD